MLIRVLLIIISTLMLLFSSGPVSPPVTGARLTELHTSGKPEDFKVEFFPVAPYHVGDKISIRVTYTGTGNIEGKEIHIALSDQPGTILGTESFSRYDSQAELFWILDTSTFQPGFIRFRFELPEVNRSWQEGINLLPPKTGKTHDWISVETNWGKIYFIEGTDAARDIEQIQGIVEETVEETLNQFFPGGIPQENPLEDGLNFVLVPAIIGHGGFAADMAVVTYADRNWVGSSFETIIHHELVHILDRKLNNDGPRPSILSEGIAVYLSGGHYRDGDPLLRASALVTLENYIPFETLADDFYNAQHEVAYMEGAALVAYLTEIWGWEDFLHFYFNLEDEGSDSSTISAALVNKTGMDLNQLESAFLTYLDTLDPNDAVISDVRLTIEVYDMIRRYQTAVIPSAHFRTAWWPSIDKILEMGITGDYDQREKAPLNIIIENQFIDIQKTFSAKDYQRLEKQLDRIEKYLDIIEGLESSPTHYHLGWPLPHYTQIITKP